jgi:RNA polymerase sigma factor (sigma-70 family)
MDAPTSEPRPLTAPNLPPAGTSREAWDARATELMAAFRDSRSQEDFESLYAYTERDVLIWIYSLLRQGSNQLDPSELLQDTFVNVFRYPSSFRDEGASSFRVWVRTIAGNVVRRSRSKLAAKAMAPLVEETLQVADGAPGPESYAAWGEQTAELERAWALFLEVYLEAWSGLVKRDKQALELVEVEGLDYRRAAAELAVRAPNMKMIVFRSRQRLAKRMGEVFDAFREASVVPATELAPTIAPCTRTAQDTRTRVRARTSFNSPPAGFATALG